MQARYASRSIEQRGGGVLVNGDQEGGSYRTIENRKGANNRRSPSLSRYSTQLAACLAIIPICFQLKISVCI